MSGFENIDSFDAAKPGGPLPSGRGQVRAICTAVKNERRYIIEWVAYHRAVGIEEFYVYDNESDDGTSLILDKLHKEGVINRFVWMTPKDKSPQLTAFQDFIEYNAYSRDYVGFLDADEFVSIPSGCSSVAEYFDRNDLMRPEVGAVAINQRVFGSSGKLKYEPKFVIDRFSRCAEDDYEENRWYKSFCRPSSVLRVVTPHYFELKSAGYYDCYGIPLDAASISGGCLDRVRPDLRINHYIIKSLEEFRQKQNRGGGAGQTQEQRRSRYSDGFFFGRDEFINKGKWAFDLPLMDTVRRNALDLYSLVYG